MLMMGKEKEEQDNGKRGESNDMKWKQDVGQESK